MHKFDHIAISSHVVGCVLLVTAPAVFAAGDKVAQIAGWQHRVVEFQTTKSETNEELAAPKLIRLLKKENEFVNLTLTKGRWTVGKVGQDAEKYLHYYTELFDSVLSVAPEDPSAYVVLAQGAYDPNSNAADKILERSELVWAVFITDAKNVNPVKRAQAVEMLGKVAAERSSSLSSQELTKIKLTFKSALKDREYLVRSKAIDGVVYAGFNDLVPELREIALTDNASTSITGRVTYPVREEAQSAIYRLQSKPLSSK